MSYYLTKQTNNNNKTPHNHPTKWTKQLSAAFSPPKTSTLDFSTVLDFSKIVCPPTIQIPVKLLMAGDEPQRKEHLHPVTLYPARLPQVTHSIPFLYCRLVCLFLADSKTTTNIKVDLYLLAIATARNDYIALIHIEVIGQPLCRCCSCLNLTTL